jgi:hypothetical protein
MVVQVVAHLNGAEAKAISAGKPPHRALCDRWSILEKSLMFGDNTMHLCKNLGPITALAACLLVNPAVQAPRRGHGWFAADYC